MVRQERDSGFTRERERERERESQMLMHAGARGSPRCMLGMAVPWQLLQVPQVFVVLKLHALIISIFAALGSVVLCTWWRITLYVCECLVFCMEATTDIAGSPNPAQKVVIC
jgi:hypothetical protein